jgi:DNA repair exonuclease SbcCD ATPase subunit
MLRIQSLNPTGMFSFGECQDINLVDKGLVSLQGINRDAFESSNGSGKSSVFNSICEILYQENPTRVSGDGVINSVWNRGFCGRVTFSSWENITYRVTYCRKWKKPIFDADNDNRTEYSGTALFLDKFVDDGWVDCRGPSMKETKHKVQEAVGLTYSQFLSIAYVTPRQGNTILRGTNAERMELLSSLSGLDVWDKILDRIKHRRKFAVQNKNEKETKIAHITGQIDQINAQISSTNLDNVLNDISEAQAKQQEVQGLQADSENKKLGLVSELETLKVQKAEAWSTLGLGSHQSEIALIDSEISELKVQRSQCRTSINPGLAKEFEDAQAAFNLAKGKLAAIKGDNPLIDIENCPTCGARITKTAKSKMEKVIAEAEALVDKTRERVQEIYDSVEADKKAQEAEVSKQIAGLDEAIKVLEGKRSVKQSDYNARMVEYNRFDTLIYDKQSEISTVENHISQCKQAEVNWSTRIESLKASCDRVKQLETDLDKLNMDKGGLQVELENLIHDEIACFDWFVTNIPYIKLHKLSVSLLELSNAANEYLRQMGDTACINVSSFKEKKKSKSGGLSIDQLKGEISVTITDGKKDIDPRLYSDGETSKFSTALIRALRDLAMKNGQGCNVLLLDEIFSFSDNTNVQRVADAFLGHLTDTTPTCILTDNSGKLNDLVSFDQTWKVTKADGVSVFSE